MPGMPGEICVRCRFRTGYLRGEASKEPPPLQPLDQCLQSLDSHVTSQFILTKHGMCKGDEPCFASVSFRSWLVFRGACCNSMISRDCSPQHGPILPVAIATTARSS